MPNSEIRFAPKIRTMLANAIAEAGGNEVFFIGKLDESGCVDECRIVARGHESAVPAIWSAIEDGDVLIHNHPSGHLFPSDPDLSIAARAAEAGLGFYIINNTAADVYAVVEPVLSAHTEKIDEDELAGFLEETGPLASFSETYEPRESQIQLVRAIGRAFNTGSVGVFEAGTGVGKSFAYLLPAMKWAEANKDRVVVSTGTINLQQQLMEKDIPAARKIIGRDIKCVLMKGRQNYVCKRRLHEALQEARNERDFFEDENEELESIAVWADSSPDGSRSDLSFVPKDQVWSRICSESDTCMGMRCPFHEECFVMRIRKEASTAGIIIVNHHLLFADIEARMSGAGYDDTAVLPYFHHVVFDEAHGMEDAATSFFSENFTRFKIQKQLGVFWRTRRNSVGGHLIALERLSTAEGDAGDAVSAISDVREWYAKTEETALSVMGDSFSWRLCAATAAQAAGLLEMLAELRKRIAEVSGRIRTLIEGIDDEFQDDPVVWESKFALRRLEFAGTLCLNFCEWKERPESVFWLEKCRLPARSARARDADIWYPRFVQTPLSIANMMKEGVFEPLQTVICTSATLKIGHSFDYWLKRTGVNQLSEDRVLQGSFESPFPYKSRVLFAIPEDAPLPDDRGFQAYIETAVVSLLQASAGHALVLFTSYESLRSACAVARSALAPLGIQVFRQGDDDRARLLEQFKADDTSVLFATDSFWEGVDAPGDTLLHVIIVKLPFRVPNDPVHEARSEFLEQSGRNPFMELSLPEAVIRFRQGFGRLMRKKTDRGVVTVLDRRVLSKRYGQLFIDSVPETVRCFSPLMDVINKVERFLYP